MKRLNTSAATAAVVLLFGAWIKTATTSAGAPRHHALPSERSQVTCGLPGGYEPITSISTMWVATAATPYIMVNSSSGCVLLENLGEHAVGRLCAHEELAGHQRPATGAGQVGPDVASRSNRRRRSRNITGSTSAEHISKAGGNGPFRVGQTQVLWLVTPPETLTVPLPKRSWWTLAPTEGMSLQASPVFHDSSGGTNSDNSESRWRRYEHNAPPIPDAFMARYVHVLMYLADILQADQVSAFLFGRWPPRYYQRMRANRFDRRRRRRRRRFAMYAYDIGMLFRDAWRTNRASSCCIEDLPVTAVASATAPLASAPAEPATSVISVPSSLVSSNDPIASLASAAVVPVTSAVSASSSLVSSNAQSDPSAVNSALSQPNDEMECLSRLGVALLLEGSIAPCPTTAKNQAPHVSMTAPPSAAATERGCTEEFDKDMACLSVQGLCLLLEGSFAPHPTLATDLNNPLSPMAMVASSAADVHDMRHIENLTRSPANTTAKQEKEQLSVLGVTLLLQGCDEPCPRMGSTTLKDRASLVAMTASPVGGAINISCAAAIGYDEGCLSALGVNLLLRESAPTRIRTTPATTVKNRASLLAMTVPPVSVSVHRGHAEAIDNDEGCFSALGVNLLLQEYATTCGCATPATAKNRASLLAMTVPPVSASGGHGYAEDMETPATSGTVNLRVATYEETDGRADTAGSPMDPCFSRCGATVTHEQGMETLATSGTANMRLITYEEPDGRADTAGTPMDPCFSRCGATVTHEQGMETLATSGTANLRVATFEELDGHADTSGTPTDPFFVSELFTPPGVSHVFDNGDVYTTIFVSYLHRFSNASAVYTEDDPLVTEEADVSDVLWPAVNARLRSKWSRSCVQTADCEYYSSSVDAVFVSRAVPDYNDWAILRKLVKQLL